MPKTTKRAASKRAAKIAKAHATDLPRLEVKAPPRRSPGEKRPARGLARYPWAAFLSLLVIAAAVVSLYYYHLGPFAPPAKPKKTATVSPCVASSVIKQLTDTSAPPTTAEFNKTQHTYSKAPAMSINTKKLYCVGLNTNRGLIVLELDPSLAPNTVNNFVFLAQHKFYDGMKFYRVVPNFVVQTGSPTGTTSGGPGYKFNDEPVKGNYTQGCVAMANSGPNTNGSQFFICTANDTSKLQKKYNLFGHVVQGMNVLLKIQGPDPDSGSSAAAQKITPDTLNHVLVVAVNP
ncbi:MAG TPA: peptidylprolyl isomerase [Ktedonobacteraceae bacterium]|nr:peptidylprolyl isomerase [Ktedonobacteraceae bacterium]